MQIDFSIHSLRPLPIKDYFQTMNDEIFRRFEDIPSKEMLPGFIATLVHTDSNTFNFIQATAGSSFPLHQHPHQQCAFVLEGIFELTVGNETTRLDSGIFAVIPPNIPHGGSAITNCKLLDIFSPVREDYK